MNSEADSRDGLPATWALADVEGWFTQGLDGVTVARMDAYRNDSRELENVELHLAVPDVLPVGAVASFQKQLQRLGGRAQMGSHFRLPAIAEVALTALARGRFRGVRLVSADGDQLFHNHDRYTDSRTASGLLTEAGHRATRCEDVAVEAVDDDFEDCVAMLRLRHNAKHGSCLVQLRYDGRVQEEDFAATLLALRQGLAASGTPAS